MDVAVQVWTEGDDVIVTVADGGPGFVPEQATANGHLGLVGIRERAELLGRTFRVTSAPGRGTTVTARWPLERTEPG